MKTAVEVRIADEDLAEVPTAGPALSRLLDEEIVKFEAWMNKNLGGGLTQIERAAVKTYLYQKIVGRVDQLEQRPLDVTELIVAKTG